MSDANRNDSSRCSGPDRSSLWRAAGLRVPFRAARSPLKLAVAVLAWAAAPADLAGQQAAPRQPLTETVEGTLVTFEMLPVGGGTVQIETAEGPKDFEVGPFWIGATEVTWDLYDVYVFGLDQRAGGEADAVAKPSKPYVLPGDDFGHAGLPALGMTYRAATEFARWLSAKTGQTYRVPTEAEWVLACREGTADRTSTALDDVAWYRANAQRRAHAVARLGADAIGAFDVLGNAAEWVAGADGGPVAKGGAWSDDAEAVNCEARRKQTPAWNASDPQLPKSGWWLSDAPFVGMRLVLER